MSETEPKTEVFTIEGVDAGDTQEKGKDMTRKRMPAVFERHVQPCLAELFGTAMFVFVGCVSVVGNLGVDGSLQPALAHGLALGVLIMVFGQISGGHFNPVVSLSVFLCGGMDIVLLGPYILAQILGGMAGAGLVKAVSPAPLFLAASGGAFDVVKATTAPGGATVVEMILTHFLTTVVCMGAVNRHTRSRLAPLCIGLTVAAGILAGGTVSGGCMNPARAFGPAVVANYWDHHWIYWVGPTCGALLTVTLVRLFFGDQRTRVVLK